MDRAVIALLIIGLVITWLLTSSIGALIKINQQGGSPGTYLLTMHMSIPQPPLALPPINITIPQHINATETARVYVPLVPIPIVIPNMPTGIVGSVPISPPRTQYAVPSGGLGMGNSQGGAGNVGFASRVVIPLRVPPILIITLLISVVILMGIGSVIIIRRNAINKGGDHGFNAGGAPAVIRTGGRVIDRGYSKKGMNSVDLLPGEVVRELRGWGGSEIVDLGIPRDLPLIWQFNEPLPILTRDGYSVNVLGPGVIRGSSLIMPKPGCYGVRVEGAGHVETLFIRATEYNEDVVKLMRLNIADYGLDDSLTMREIINELVRNGVVIGDLDEVRRLVRVFEEVRYGLRRIDRSTYEGFLRALRNIFSSPRVIVCEGA
ncbi:MAG: DUF4129 domain-containing protein [Vulcanisaeta sp.]|nr:DUF4129 domain-containing protein [Vulcanisaeta sp.]MCG2895544.1 DUF4129 domain-containing protein [Vulcanisaeta sp.]